MHSEGYCSRSVCVCECPGHTSATRATKRQTRHTGGLSIVFTSVYIWRVSYNGFVAIAFPYLRAHGSRPFFIRETGSFSTFLPYTTLVIARVR